MRGGKLWIAWIGGKETLGGTDKREVLDEAVRRCGGAIIEESKEDVRHHLESGSEGDLVFFGCQTKEKVATEGPRSAIRVMLRLADRVGKP